MERQAVTETPDRPWRVVWLGNRSTRIVRVFSHRWTAILYRAWRNSNEAGHRYQVEANRPHADQPDVPGSLVLDWISAHLAAPDQGAPFVLYPWQADFVLKLYASSPDDILRARRRTRAHPPRAARIDRSRR